ncbi:serine/threonine-protein kinase [Kineosporia succinea]
MPLSPLRAGDPATIGTFRLVARLGTGGMGVVYVGTDSAGRPAAVKTVKAEHAADPRFRARFRREVAAASAVTGACTARVLGADPDADEPWLATEYVGGASLHDVVGADGPLTPELLHALASGLAEALVAIHTAGVVHRDLKPANVLLAPDGPKVIDFGIAALETATLATRTGVGLGSPGYMAPEQITGTTTIGPPADVYAWGLTMVYAATGHSPFGSGPAPALMYRAVHAEVDLTGLPDWLEPIVRAALTREPESRPTATQVLGGLVDEEQRTRPLTRGAQAPVEGGRRARRAEREAQQRNPAAAPPAGADPNAATGNGRAGRASTPGPENPAHDPRPAETALHPEGAAYAAATEQILHREWHQPSAAQAPSLPAEPLWATPTPGHPAPGPHTSGHPTPSHATPSHATPGHATPGHATPGRLSPGVPAYGTPPDASPAGPGTRATAPGTGPGASTLRARLPLILTSAAAFVLAGALAWVLFLARTIPGSPPPPQTRPRERRRRPSPTRPQALLPTPRRRRRTRPGPPRPPAPPPRAGSRSTPTESPRTAVNSAILRSRPASTTSSPRTTATPCGSTPAPPTPSTSTRTSSSVPATTRSSTTHTSPCSSATTCPRARNPTSPPKPPAPPRLT